jgi:hypothetical protein
VALLLDTHLKPHETLSEIHHFYWTDCFPERKAETAVAFRKGIPHNHIDLPPATGGCIPVGNSEVPLATVSKSPGHALNDADIIEL